MTGEKAPNFSTFFRSLLFVYLIKENARFPDEMSVDSTEIGRGTSFVFLKDTWDMECR